MEMDFVLRSGENLPISAHERMRAAGPVVWSETLNGWLVSSYEAVREVLDAERLQRCNYLSSTGISRSPDTVQAGISRTLASLPDGSSTKCAIFSGTAISARNASSSAPISFS